MDEQCKCSSCKQVKATSEFYTQGSRLDIYCKPCRLQYNREYKNRMTIKQRERLRETGREAQKRFREQRKKTAQAMASILTGSSNNESDYA